MEIRKSRTGKTPNILSYFTPKLECKIKIGTDIRAIPALTLTVKLLLPPLHSSTFSGGNKERNPRKSCAGCTPAVCNAVS